MVKRTSYRPVDLIVLLIKSISNVKFRCTFCAKHIQEFDKAGDYYKGKEQPFALAKVDCRENEETCLKYEIALDYYPTMKIFRKGILGQNYEGLEDAGIILFNE